MYHFVMFHTVWRGKIFEKASFWQDSKNKCEVVRDKSSIKNASDHLSNGSVLPIKKFDTHRHTRDADASTDVGESRVGV